MGLQPLTAHCAFNTFIKKLLLISLSIIIISGCASETMVPKPGPVAIENKMGYSCSLDSLKSGYKLYIHKCGNCHFLYRPSKFSNEKWEAKLPEMSVKAKITTGEKNLILAYILTIKKIQSDQRRGQ